MKIIGISGRAQHGKDTVALMIKKELEEGKYDVLITHYADLLKYICKTFLNWNGEKDEDGRRLLQYVGTDIIRSRSPDYWVNFILDMLTFFDGRWDYVLIPDVRFPNEIVKLRENGLDIIHLHINRPHMDNILTIEQQNHVSETAILNIKPDFYLLNDGDLHDLETKVKNWIKESIAYGSTN